MISHDRRRRCPAGCCASAEEPRKVAFGKKPLAVGTRIEQKSLMHMTMKLAVKDPPPGAGGTPRLGFDVSSDAKEVFTEQLLALEGDVPTGEGDLDPRGPRSRSRTVARRRSPTCWPGRPTS